MNLRAVVAVVYIVVFLVNLLYAILVAPTIILELGAHLALVYLAVIAVSLVFSFFGASLTVWIYKDGQNIERLNWRVEYLERKVREQEQKE